MVKPPDPVPKNGTQEGFRTALGIGGAVFLLGLYLIGSLQPLLSNDRQDSDTEERSCECPCNFSAAAGNEPQNPTSVGFAAKPSLAAKGISKPRGLLTGEYSL